MKIGLYVLPNEQPCGGEEGPTSKPGWPSGLPETGSMGREYTDAATFADWEIDYLKFDWCGVLEAGLYGQAGTVFELWNDAIDASGRDMLVAASTWGWEHEQTWGPTFAHAWRIDGDVAPNWTDVLRTLDKGSTTTLRSASGPTKGWNDFDTMQAGNPGLSTEESRSHFLMWAMSNSPLILGNDIGTASPAFISMVSNPEIIAINQDPIGEQAWLVRDTAGLQVWGRSLSDGTKAVALLNRTSSAANIAVNFSDVFLGSASGSVRNLLDHSDKGLITGSYTVNFAAHDTVVLKLNPATVLEAESGPRTGTAAVQTCATCSGGKNVGYVGNGSGGTLTLAPNVNTDSAERNTMGTMDTEQLPAPEGQPRVMNEVEQADRTIAAVSLLRGAPMAAVQVLTTILTRGPVSRVEIARTTGLSQAAVTKAAAPMILAGIVSDDERGRPDGHPGRPASPLRVIPEALVTIGVKITEDEIVAVATDLLTGVLASYHLPLESTALDGVVDRVCDAIAKLEGMIEGATDRIVGVGVAVSGDVNTKNGVVRQSALMGWTAVPLGELLAARLNREVVVENDVRALTIGEHWFGVGVGTASFAIVTIGRGIGCGLHLNGDVVEGAHGVAGELGHLPLTSRDHLCSCGRRGCVEAVASSEAIVREIVRQRGEPLTLEEAHLLARSGDPVALSVFHEAARVIGTAIATMANLAGPELIIIGGEEVRDFDLFDAELRAAFSEHAFGAAGESRIVLRPHTFEDWARGAAASVIRNLVTGGHPR